jgi:transcriptional regulator with XRE-family HTH domain
MGIASPEIGFGDLLRDWRQRRRMSQLDLAVEADVSARHLSFVETGRSQPSRNLVIDLAEHLDVPLRERNALLLAAGYAPVYRETPLDTAEMSPVREALDRLLGGHEPFPAIVVDRRWNLVSANRPAMAVMSDGVAPWLLAPPVNTLRITLHPRGMAPHIVNFAEYSAHLLEQVHRQALLAGDPVLFELEQEFKSYPGVREPSGHPNPTSSLFVPFILRVADGVDLTFFSTLTTFGTALDITVAELTIEALFPGDAPTAAAVRAAWG